MTKLIFIFADHGMAIIAGTNPLLSTWKRFALAQQVRFSGLPRTEAGIYPAETETRSK